MSGLSKIYNNMDQLTFRFPFSKKYYEQDYYVSSNNFSAFKLIDEWPEWPGKWLNIYGAKGSGKTHLSKILENKIKKSRLISANKINNNIIKDLNTEIKKDKNMNYIKYEILNPLIEHIVQQLYPYFIKMIIIVIIFFILIIFIIILNLRIIYT